MVPALKHLEGRRRWRLLSTPCASSHADLLRTFELVSLGLDALASSAPGPPPPPVLTCLSVSSLRTEGKGPGWPLAPMGTGDSRPQARFPLHLPFREVSKGWGFLGAMASATQPVSVGLGACPSGRAAAPDLGVLSGPGLGAGA